MCRAQHSQSGVVTWLLCISAGFNFTEVLLVYRCQSLLGFAGKCGFILLNPTDKTFIDTGLGEICLPAFVFLYILR